VWCNLSVINYSAKVVVYRGNDIIFVRLETAKDTEDLVKCIATNFNDSLKFVREKLEVDTNIEKSLREKMIL